MDRVFLTVLNMSLTGAFVILAICLARLPLRKAPKIISYCLWAVAGFRLAVPFSIESIFSLIPFRAQPIPLDIAAPAPVIPPPLPGTAANIPMDTLLPVVPYSGGGGTLPAFIRFTGYNAPSGFEGLSLWQILLNAGMYVWLLGTAVMLVYGIASYIRLKRKMRGSVCVEPGIYEAGNIRSPFVLGVFSPRIYLPSGLSERQWVYIILHEQTHIRRYDHVVKFAAYFILCLHWFNPLAWVAFTLMGRDMEMSCDERVLKELGSEVKKHYSLSLLSLAMGRSIIAGSPLAFGEGDIKERVKNVLKFKKQSKFIFALTVMLAVVFSAGFMVSRGDTPQENRPTAEEIVRFQIEFAEYHGFYDLAASMMRQLEDEIPVMPQFILDMFPTLEDVRIHLEEIVLPDLLMQDARLLEWELRLAEMNRFGYEPLHDLSIIKFTEGEPIAVYLELDGIDLQGRTAHGVRVANRDLVLLPLEPVFDALGIEYVWDEAANLLHISGFVDWMNREIILQPGLAGHSTNVRDYPGEGFIVCASDHAPVLLERKPGGLYIHHIIFRNLLRESIRDDYSSYLLQQILADDYDSHIFWGPSAYQPWFPLIYHDLHKVVIVTRDRINYPNYQIKNIAMETQFTRARMPVYGDISVFIRHTGTQEVLHFVYGDMDSFTPVRTRAEAVEVDFQTGSAFVINTAGYDYVMLPAAEIFGLIGVDYYWNQLESSLTVRFDDAEYVITDGVPLFDSSWDIGFLNEILPHMIDGVLYISHADLNRIFWPSLSQRTTGVFVGLARTLPEFGGSFLEIEVWEMGIWLDNFDAIIVP